MAAAVPIALVVEDNLVIRMDVVGILEGAGFRTLSAGSADEAIPLLIEHEGAVILLFSDVQMPGSMDGLGLARHVAATWPEVGILIASGALTPAPDELPEDAIFIRKPFSGEVVHARVRELLPDGRQPQPLSRSAEG